MLTTVGFEPISSSHSHRRGHATHDVPIAPLAGVLCRTQGAHTVQGVHAYDSIGWGYTTKAPGAQPVGAALWGLHHGATTLGIAVTRWLVKSAHGAESDRLNGRGGSTS